MDFLLCETVDDLKVECTCTTCLSLVLREVTWPATVVARSIQSCPVLTRDQSCVVLCSSFLLGKGVFHALFVLASFSIPEIFIGLRLLFSLNPTFCVD